MLVRTLPSTLLCATLVATLLACSSADAPGDGGAPSGENPAADAGHAAGANSGTNAKMAADANPAAEGFNGADSDPRAIELADSVMEAMGGREAWDDTRYLSWSFFGRRHHVWDKWTGRYRIEFDDEAGDHFVLLGNVHRPGEGNGRGDSAGHADGGGPRDSADRPDAGGRLRADPSQGAAYRNGERITDEVEHAEWMNRAYRAWINDSYWLVMPYKLKDSGVTLKYVGEGTTSDGRAAEILQLSFEDVGVTPQNKYQVYVVNETGLIEEWAFFREAGDDEPGFRTPWAGWERYGAILLSGDRGDGRMLENIAVTGEMPDSVFESPAPMDTPDFGQRGPVREP